MSLTDEAHQLIRSHLRDRIAHLELAIDATCGKGRDTQFLLDLGFSKVFAFDIQQAAIDQTQQLISIDQAAASKVSLIHDSHENMAIHLAADGLNRSAQCIMFNLGYLPSADKTVTTIAESSIKAINQSLTLLSEDGILSIMIYPGHPAGLAEHAAIAAWLQTLKDPWTHTRHNGAAPTPTSPILFLVHRQK